MATNLIYNGAEGLAVICSDPATPASGDPVRFGEKCGVALIAERADGLTTVDFEAGHVYDLSVKGVDGVGNSAVALGDKLYYVDADTPKISKKNTGRVFGYAMEVINAGATDTINVMLA
jgi:predicted RecA/RadA family phage recombinase